MHAHTHICKGALPWSPPVPCFFPIAIYSCESPHLTLNMGVRMNSHSFNFLGLESEVKILVAPSCLTLCDSTDCSLCPWDSPGKNTGGSHSLLQVILDVKGSLLFFFFTVVSSLRLWVLTVVETQLGNRLDSLDRTNGLLLTSFPPSPECIRTNSFL